MIKRNFTASQRRKMYIQLFHFDNQDLFSGEKEILFFPPVSLSPLAKRGCESPKPWQPCGDRRRQPLKQNDSMKSREVTCKELIFGAPLRYYIKPLQSLP